MLWLAALLSGPRVFAADAPPAPAAATAAVAAEPVKAPAELPTLYIISDSTAALNSGNGIVGWGKPFADYFDPAKVRVVDKAIAARSSRSFLAENHWAPIVAQLKAGDLVLLQFGHNDTGTPNPNPRGDRPSLPGLGEETLDTTANGRPVTVHTYGWYMRQYIADAKAKGAQVVVLSVTVRDIWTNPNATFGTDLDKTAVIATKTDKYNPADDKVERGLDDGHGHNYAAEAREIAQSQNVPFVDLTNLNADQYEKMGREKAAGFYQTQKVDHTHSNAAGADFNAAAIVAGLKALKNNPFAALLSEKGQAVPAAAAKYVADNSASKEPGATTSAKNAPDPRNGLDTAMADLLVLVKAGDFATLFNRYAPPAVLALVPAEIRPQMGSAIQTAMQTPQARSNLRMMTDVLEAAQTVKPSFNAPGDRATFEVTKPVGPEQATGRVLLQKVDGKWYLDNNMLMSLGQMLGIIPKPAMTTATTSTPPRPRGPDTHGVDMRTQTGPGTERYNPPFPVEEKLPTLWLIGDSTVRNGSAGNGATNAPNGQWGWGAPLTFYFDPAKVNVVNRALGGTSARSFYTNNWKKMVDLIKKGDVVLMQFGTNDGGDPTKSVSELKGIEEETQNITNAAGQPETIHTYGWYMRQLIAETRAKGATPIICSLIPRKTWANDGHINRTTNYEGWARDIAAAEKIGFIDLNELIARKLDALGRAKVDELYVPTPAEAAAKGGKAETVHPGWDGAVINAEVVVSGLKALKDDPVADYFSEKGQAIAPAPDLGKPAASAAK